MQGNHRSLRAREPPTSQVLEARATLALPPRSKAVYTRKCGELGRLLPPLQHSGFTKVQLPEASFTEAKNREELLGDKCRAPSVWGNVKIKIQCFVSHKHIGEKKKKKKLSALLSI